MNALERIALLVVAAALLAAVTPSESRACPYERQAASTHAKVVRLFRKCSADLAKGGSCNTALRDAALQGIIAKGAAKLLAKCEANTAGWGFSSVSELAGQHAGNAAGEGRHLVDLVYGRDPVPLSKDEQKCADALVAKSATAVKKMVKLAIPCAPNCNSAVQAYADSFFDGAGAKIAKVCSTAAIGSLVGGDLAAFLAEAKASAQRLAESRTKKANPVVNVLTPELNALFEPASVPASIDTAAVLANVGSQAYVTSLEVNGHPATYNPVTNRFEHDLLVTSLQSPNFPILFKMRTTRGTLIGSGNLKISLEGISPHVKILSPQSGSISAANSVDVVGKVYNLANAGPLFLGGQPINYLTSGLLAGFFFATVPLGSNPVQYLEAEIHSEVSTAVETDSVVVLRGIAVDVDDPVGNSVAIRVNNSGFAATEALVHAKVEPILKPSALIGYQVPGAEVCDFSHGPISTSLGSFGPQAMRLGIEIEDFELDICFSYIAANCVAHYTAAAVEVTSEFDFISVNGALNVDVTSTTTNFVGDGFSAIDGPPECVNGIVLGGAHTMIEDAIADVAEEKVPPAIEEAVADIDLGSPLSEGLGLELTGHHLQPLEDNDGVTFRFNANAVAPYPVIGGLPLPEYSLFPFGGGTPILNATIPGNGSEYGLGLWVSDAFLNRYVTALLRAGELHQNVTQVPADPDCSDVSNPACVFLALQTWVLDLLFADTAYSSACPNCFVTLNLQPTAGAVVRQANPGENGDFVLVIPNYRVEAFSLVGFNEFVHYLTVLTTFELPISLEVSSGAVTPVAGALKVTHVEVADNPIGADESNVPAVIAQLFPKAAGAISSTFSALPLPEIEGLQLSGVGSGYNVAGTALYMDLLP
jgi:hypothetical protein